VPYLYHLRFGGDEPRQLVGASPEMLVRVRKGIVETFPIAGTREVTGDEATDAAAATALLVDTKETAEHAMLVDLARNDLGRVCEAGTIDVVSYQQVQRFHRVQHLVSHVRGRLHKNHDAWDALAAVFPAGTVSGAPKVRAMEHIDAIESRPRGAYAGSVAYVSFNGDLDSAIAIRSLSAVGGNLTVQAGAGVVHRSDPRMEFEETSHKASTLLQTIAEFQEGG
jgi:anthranilate synthase component 1